MIRRSEEGTRFYMLMRDKLLNETRWSVGLPLEMRCTRAEMDDYRLLICRTIRQAATFEVSNVAEYLYEGTSREVWHLGEDFPRPMPPFRTCWFEWKLPRRVMVGDHFEPLQIRGEFERVGCLIVCADGTKPWQLVNIQVHVFVEVIGGTPGCLIIIQFYLDQDWQPRVELGEEGAKKIMYGYPGIRPELADVQDGEVGKEKMYLKELSTLWLPAALAISLLNCRNVETKTVSAPAALVKKHRKLRREVAASHLMIEIQPMMAKIRNATGESGYGRNAAAIVRGHFKDYTKGAGLFGRNKGLFWWDQRVAAPLSTTVEYRLKNSIGGLDSKWNHSSGNPAAR